MSNAKDYKTRLSVEKTSVKNLILMLSMFIAPWTMGLLANSRIVGSTNPSYMAFAGTTLSMVAAGVIIAYFVCLCSSAWHRDAGKVVRYITCISIAVLLWLASAESRTFETVFAEALNQRLCDLNVKEFRNRCSELLGKTESGEIENRNAYTFEQYRVLESVDSWLPARPSDVGVFEIRNSTEEERVVVVQWSAFMQAYGLVFRHSTTNKPLPRFRLQARTYPSTEQGIYLWAGIRSHGVNNTRRLREQFAADAGSALQNTLNKEALGSSIKGGVIH